MLDTTALDPQEVKIHIFEPPPSKVSQHADLFVWFRDVVRETKLYGQRILDAYVCFVL